MDAFLEVVAREIFWVIFGLVIILGMVIKAVTTILTTAARERSRREIAAYIAEGSMTPEQGERLIRADVASHDRHEA